LGSRGSITAHCSSVSSCLVLIFPFYIGRSCF
jgi:hypothetical protein